MRPFSNSVFGLLILSSSLSLAAINSDGFLNDTQARFLMKNNVSLANSEKIDQLYPKGERAPSGYTVELHCSNTPRRTDKQCRIVRVKADRPSVN